MKRILFKTIGIATTLALMLGAFTACGGDNSGSNATGNGAFDNGNVLTVTEEGIVLNLPACAVVEVTIRG
jgi:hypothetical protein